MINREIELCSVIVIHKPDCILTGISPTVLYGSFTYIGLTVLIVLSLIRLTVLAVLSLVGLTVFYHKLPCCGLSSCAC